MGMDPNRKIATDDSGGKNYAKIAPATAILNVSKTAELSGSFQSISVNGEKLDAKNISYEGIVSWAVRTMSSSKMSTKRSPSTM